MICMQEFPLQGALSDPPSENEVERALGRLSVSKAGGVLWLISL